MEFHLRPAKGRLAAAGRVLAVVVLAASALILFGTLLSMMF